MWEATVRFPKSQTTTQENDVGFRMEAEVCSCKLSPPRPLPPGARLRPVLGQTACRGRSPPATGTLVGSGAVCLVGGVLRWPQRRKCSSVDDQSILVSRSCTRHSSVCLYSFFAKVWRNRWVFFDQWFFRRPCAMLSCRNSLLSAVKCFHTRFPGCDHLSLLPVTTYCNCNSATMDLSLKPDLWEWSSSS